MQQSTHDYWMRLSELWLHERAYDHVLVKQVCSKLVVVNAVYLHDTDVRFPS
jgi:hypothetical protein